MQLVISHLIQDLSLFRLNLVTDGDNENHCFPYFPYKKSHRIKRWLSILLTEDETITFLRFLYHHYH